VTTDSFPPGLYYYYLMIDGTDFLIQLVSYFMEQ